MNSFAELGSEKQIELLSAHAWAVLAFYDIGTIASVESINHEFNSTFAVESADGTRYALRINVNSDRNLANANAEIEFINHLANATDLNFANPIAKSDGSFVSCETFEPLGRAVVSVLFSWLEGEELGDEPTLEQLDQVGAAMAKMHEASLGLALSSTAELPLLRDVLWRTENLLTGPNAKLSGAAQSVVGLALEQIDKAVAALYQRDSVRPIHADMHGWNLMWHDESLSVFDFDDSGLGLPIQDIFTAIYYLDTPEQEAALLAGYASVRPVPQHSEFEKEALLLQRRLILLNYLFSTSTAEHRDMLPKYLEESLKRVDKFLSLSS
jgi:Ser/Thr protein kinase RdoA (MazF antagonist)